MITENGPLMVVVDRGNGPHEVLAFATGVLALVYGGFGAVIRGSTFVRSSQRAQQAHCGGDQRRNGGPIWGLNAIVRGVG